VKVKFTIKQGEVVAVSGLGQFTAGTHLIDVTTDQKQALIAAGVKVSGGSNHASK